MDVPSVPTYIPSAPEELDDFPELAVFVGGMHWKGLYRLGSWNQPFVNKIFTRKLFKSDSFAILRQTIPDYHEASGLFNIQVDFPSKERGKLMLETIVDYFSESGPFLYRDLFVGVSYNQVLGEFFILKFHNQLFADEVSSCLRIILTKSFEEVYLRTVILADGSPLFFSPEDLLPLAPSNGPSWKLYANGQLVEELQRFSQVFEYMHFMGPSDMIPAVSLCHSEYIPAQSAAVQVKITIKGMSLPEQAHHIYLLFSYLLPEIQAENGNLMLQKFLHMKNDVGKSNVELYLSFRPDVDLVELKKEINFVFFKVLLRISLGFRIECSKFKMSSFYIEGSAPKECNAPHLYRVIMRDYFKLDKKKPAILKFSPEPAEVKCLMFFKATFKLDESIHIDRLFSGLYQLLGRHEYDELNGFDLMEIKLSPIGSKDDFSIQLTYANMNKNYGTIVKLFTAILRGCGIQSIPYTKVLKSMRPGAKQDVVAVPANVEMFTTKSISFDAMNTGVVPSLLAAFDSLSPIDQEVFLSFYPKEVTGVVLRAEDQNVIGIDEELKRVKPQQKSKQAITKKQAKKLRAALRAEQLSSPTDPEPSTAESSNPEPIVELLPEESSTPEPIVEKSNLVLPEECPSGDDPMEPANTTFTKTKKIKASKRHRMEARERTKQQQIVAEPTPEAKQEVAESSLQQLIEDLVGGNEPAPENDEASSETAEIVVPIETRLSEIEQSEASHFDGLETTKDSSVVIRTNSHDEVSEPKENPAPNKSYVDALLGREASSNPEANEPPRTVSPILGPVLEQSSAVLGVDINSEQSEWYTSPLVLVTPKGSDSTFAMNAGTWDMHHGEYIWWSSFWQQHTAIHVIRKKLFATPRCSHGPRLMSLVIAVPENTCVQLLKNLLKWIETDPMAYIRHRTLSFSFLRSRFIKLPETQSMNRLVITLKYPDDPDVSPWLNACARIVRTNGPLAFQLFKNVLFAPTQLSDLMDNSAPLNNDIPVTQKWTMIYDGVSDIESRDLIAIVNAVKCLGPQKFIPFGAVHRSFPPGEIPQLDHSRTVSIAPAPGLPVYSLSALFTFFLRLLNTVQYDVDEPVANWMVPMLAHLECFYFVPLSNQGTYALHIQLDKFASPEVFRDAVLLATNWSISHCQLQRMLPLTGKNRTIEHLRKAANLQYEKCQSKPLHPGHLVSLLREYLNENPLQTVSEAIVIDFGRSHLNHQPKLRWILSQVCLTNSPVANIIHFITELYYLPRWSPMIGFARRIWIKRIARFQFIVGFAVEEIEGAMANIPVLTGTLIVNSLLAGITDLHVSQPLDTMEKLEASIADTVLRMATTLCRGNEKIMSTIPVEASYLAVPKFDAAPETKVSVSVELECLGKSEQPEDDQNCKESGMEVAMSVVEEMNPEPKENVVHEADMIVIEAEEAVPNQIVENETQDVAVINTEEVPKERFPNQIVENETQEVAVINTEEVPEEPTVVEVVEVWPQTLSTTINFRGVVLDCSYTLEEPLEEPIVPIIDSEDLYLDISKIIASLPKDFFRSDKFLTISRSNSDLNDCISLQGAITTSEDVLEAALKLFESAVLNGEVPVVSVQVGPHGTVQASFKLILKPTTTIANIISIKNSAAKSIRWSTSW